MRSLGLVLVTLSLVLALDTMQRGLTLSSLHPPTKHGVEGTTISLHLLATLPHAAQNARGLFLPQGHTAGRTGFLPVRTPTASAEPLSNRTTPVCTDAWGHLPSGATSPLIVFHKVLSVLLVTFLSLRRLQMVSREVYSTGFPVTNRG